MNDEKYCATKKNKYLRKNCKIKKENVNAAKRCWKKKYKI